MSVTDVRRHSDDDQRSPETYVQNSTWYPLIGTAAVRAKPGPTRFPDTRTGYGRDLCAAGTDRLGVCDGALTGVVERCGRVPGEHPDDLGGREHLVHRFDGLSRP